MPFNRKFGYDLTIVPAVIDGNIMLDPKPKMMIISVESGEELFCFQTSAIFKFKDEFPKEETYKLIYNLIMVAVDEFNVELKEVKNCLTVNREFKKDKFEELYNDIEKAFMLNNFN